MSAAEPRYPDYVAYRVKRLYMLASQSLDDLLKPHGLGRSQWQVVSRLSADEGRSQRELQTMMQVEPATLSAIVESLVAKGWVKRADNPSDRRGRLLFLTAEGQARMTDIRDPVAAIEARMLEGVSPDQRSRLDAVLRKMTRNLERGRDE